LRGTLERAPPRMTQRETQDWQFTNQSKQV
jgi:hypothetical protein